MTGMSKTAGPRLVGKLRDRKIVELRIQGYNQQQIADALGCSQKTISKRLQKVLADLSQETRGMVDEYRALQLHECTQLKKFIWSDIVERGTITMGQIDRLLKIMEREAKLLGLDKPIKIAPTDVEGKQEWQGLSDYVWLSERIASGDFTLDE